VFYALSLYGTRMATQWAMTTGDNIGAELRRKRHTQTDLADLLGLSQAAVSRKLRGKAPMTVDELFTIAAWLDVSVMELVPDPTGAAPTDRYSTDNALLLLAA
jgi:transcriptional regulator with XRE-family HTH domain